MKKTWLKDNIRSIIAILWTLASITIFIILLFKVTKTNDATTSMIITSVVGIINFILGYYYGSSKPPTEKTGTTTTKLEINEHKDN